MKKGNRGGAGRGQGRKQQDPDKKKISRSVCLTKFAWGEIDLLASVNGTSRSKQIQQWAEKIKRTQT
jgi:hypothetical protein